MSDFASLLSPRVTSFYARLKGVIQRKASIGLLPCNSDWFINESGNFAVRVHVTLKKFGLRLGLTFREGLHSGEYVYSSSPILMPENIGLRKAYRLACHQAEHLARLRYRYL